MSNHALAEIVQTIVLLNPQNEILILRTPAGMWQLPGGRLNNDEHWEEGLRREVREETEIDDLSIDSVIRVNNWIFEGVPQYGVYFRCRTKMERIVLSREHTDFLWVGPGVNLDEFEFWHPTLRELVEQTLNQKY